jgi:hypothetical protein
MSLYYKHCQDSNPPLELVTCSSIPIVNGGDQIKGWHPTVIISQILQQKFYDEDQLFCLVEKQIVIDSGRFFIFDRIALFQIGQSHFTFVLESPG